MIAALIAAAVTLVAAIAVIVAVFVVRGRTKTPYAGQKKDVRSCFFGTGYRTILDILGLHLRDGTRH